MESKLRNEGWWFECRSINQLQICRLIKHSTIVTSLFLIISHELSKDWSVSLPPLCSAVLPTGESHQGADWTAGSVHRWAVSCSHWQETLFIWETDFQPLKYGRVTQSGCVQLLLAVSPSDVTWWRAAGGRQEEEHQTRPSIQRAARPRCQVSEQVRMQPRKEESWCQTGFSYIEVYGRWWRTETERRLNISSLRSSAQTSNQPPIGFNTGETTVWHHDSSLVRQINIITPETLNNLKSVSATRPSTFDLRPLVSVWLDSGELCDFGLKSLKYFCHFIYNMLPLIYHIINIWFLFHPPVSLPSQRRRSSSTAVIITSATRGRRLKR